MRKRLLRFSLLGMLVMLCGGGIFAALQHYTAVKEADPATLYILGVEDLNQDESTWSLPADLKAMTWDATKQVYTYNLNNTSEAYFCISDCSNDITSWDDFIGNYRWAIGNGNNNAPIGEEVQLANTYNSNPCIVLPAGTWTISVTTDKKMTITGQAADEPTTEVAYYVVGNMTDWAPNANYKMTLNEGATTTEYTYSMDLTTESQFKVVKVEEGKDNVWYPAGTGNNYGEHGEITADGKYTIYFRPNKDGGDDWFYNYIYVAANEEPVAGFRDIKADLTSTALLPNQTAPEAWTDVSTGVAVAEDGTLSRIDKEGAAIVFNGKWHGTSYGWANFTASVPVQGCVKITYATHDQGNDITVTNAEGEEVAKFNTKGAKWSSNHDNVVVAYYRTNEPTTLNFSKANYNPYFAVEAIDEKDLPAEVTKYNVTFVAGEGVDGVAPDALEINAGDKITAPKNTSLYKEGYTLTGWTAGDAVYQPGTEITPEADMILTAMFAQNEVSLADRTEAVTISYVLDGSAAQYKYEGKAGIIVTQATVNGKTIDVKANVDASGGKFAYSDNGWHQVNTGTKVTVPSCKGATISVTVYTTASSVKINGEAGEQSKQVATYTATGDDATIEVEQINNDYWNKLEITLPVVTPDYYVVGSMTEWEIDEAYKMTLNTQATGEEYMITKSLKAGDEFKIKDSKGAWYPAGTDNNYVVAADGTYDIYFRPNKDGGDDWHEGYIYAAKNEEPAEITGTIFSADVIATEAVSFNSGPTEITAAQATITGGKMYAISGQSSAKNLIALQSNVAYFSMTNNNTYFKVELDNALAVGDVITAKGNGGTKNDLNKGLWVSTSDSYPEEAPACAGTNAEDGMHDDLLSYTVKEGDEYVGKKVLYIYRAAGATQYFDNFVITRPAEEEPVAQDVTAMWDFQHNCANLPSKNDGGAYTEATMASNVNGVSMTIEYNNGQIKNNDNSYQVTNGVVLQIPVKNVGDEVIVKGYPNYAQYTVGNITVNSSNGNGATPDATYKAKASDVENGYVAITSNNNNNYIISITVNQYAPKEATTLDNEPATATFPFNLGTEGQKATFTNANYWLGSKVVLGSNFTVNGTGTVSEITETKLKVTAKETAAAESNLIKFTITPKPGLTFTPTKVTFTATRYGTDGGALDIAWLNSGKTTTTLANLKKADGNLPGRDNKTPNFTTFSYDLTTVNGIIAGDGECGLLLNLYDLDAGKNYGFANIIIEGTLSGTEKDVPVLATFTVNGKEYQVEDVFGDGYEATLKLSKTEAMVSSTNAVTATATNGEIGTITYENATETGCKVTIPVTAGETTMNYVLNVTQKPDYTLTYYAVDGTTVLDTDTREEDQTIGEFKVNIADVDASKDGYKARGWFKQNYVGAKHKTDDVVTSDLKLYAVETEIEVPSDSKKYTFDLTDVNFDATDHEAFNPVGGAWHDKQHGWVFGNGDQIKLLVGAKADIIFTLCQYSKEGSTISMGETSISAVGASDGATEAFKYEGEPGEVTLTVNSTGSVYIHSIKIVNTTTTNYTQEGNWIKVKADDASSLLDALDAAAGITGNERVYIYLPNGTYDLAQTTLTKIGRNNISIIGESMEGVIIKNKPVAEGIGTTAIFLNSSTGLYMQDLTLKNEWDYYGIAGDGRAVCLQDKGTKTVCKNVTMLSYQDTYYTNNPDGEFYWETSDIHGTVDFICGEGTLFMESSTLTVEKRYLDKNGECTLTAASTKAGNTYGYVFNNCTIQNNATSFNLGRAWNNEPRVAYISPTYSDDKLIEARWTAKGMNVVAKEFVEYNPSDGVTTNEVDFYYGDNHNKMQTIITDASRFAIDKVFTSWEPAPLAEQFVFANAATIKDGTISWTAVDGAVAYAIYENDELLNIVAGDQTSFVLPVTAPAMAPNQVSTPVYKIRIANRCGGLGVPQEVTITDGITKLNTEDMNGETVIYDLNGRRVMNPGKGVYIVNGKKTILK